MKWIPFFKTGKQTDSLGREKLWTREEIDNTACSYNKLNPENKKPIVIGHPNDNLPIVGYIDKVKRVGDTLYALPGNVSQSFKDLVKEGKFPNRSISFNKDGSINHFGFLPIGIEPAVKELGVFEFAKVETGFNNYNFKGIIEDEEFYEEDGDLWQIEAELEIINKQIEELLKNDKKELSTDNELIKIIEKQNKEAEKTAFMNRLEKFVESGKLTPAVKNKYKELAEIVTNDRSDFTAENKNIYTVLEEIIDLSEIIINFSETVKKEEQNEPKNEITKIANTYKI